MIKDESYRFGLNAFKVLGGIYAIAQYVANKLGRNIEELSFEQLKTPEVRAQVGNLTFISTTDGNHGRGVAWVARELGFKQEYICQLVAPLSGYCILKVKGFC